MYHYIVNPSSGDRSFDGIASKLKAKLRQLGIDGPFDKTIDVKDTAKITHAAIRSGAQTIVAVGGDKTVNEVITAVNESGKSSTSIGIIPLGHRNTLAGQVGITDWQHATELLAARRLRSFRLMDVNDYSFIQSCEIQMPNDDSLDSLIEVDGSYRVKAPMSRCRISNTRLSNPHLSDELLVQIYGGQPEPGLFDRLVGRSRDERDMSQLHARVIALELPADVTAQVDGRPIVDRHFRIRLSQKPVRIISARYDNGDNI